MSGVSCEVANEGLRRLSFERGGLKKRAGKKLHHSGISAKGLGKTCRLQKDQKNPIWILGFDRTSPDEGNRLDMDESRQGHVMTNSGRRILIQITFDVMNVRKPLLSTSALKHRGVTIIFITIMTTSFFETRQ